MNDDDIADLMRSAATTEVVPPASFDHSDVVAGSHRITRRRRTLVGAAAGVVLVAGIGGAVVIPNLQSHPNTASAVAAAPLVNDQSDVAQGAAAPSATEEATPELAPAGPNLVQPVPDLPTPTLAPSLPGKGPVIAVPPLGPATAGCVNPQDPGLRRELDAVFPAAKKASEAATSDICRAGGGRGVNLEISEGSTSGLLTVSYVPAGQAGDPGTLDGTSASEQTASGGTVTVTVSGDGPGAKAPYAGSVTDIAKKLAPRL